MLTKLAPVRLLGIFCGLFQVWKLSRIRIFALFFTMGLSLSLAVSACSPTSTSNSAPTQTTNQNPASQGVAVRIGYQKAATILNAMKAKKDLEKALASGSSVTWTEFPAGPPMLEAMSAGSIDFGYTGE